MNGFFGALPAAADSMLDNSRLAGCKFKGYLPRCQAPDDPGAVCGTDQPATRFVQWLCAAWSGDDDA